jgi:hypothetical protein
VGTNEKNSLQRRTQQNKHKFHNSRGGKNKSNWKKNTTKQTIISQLKRGKKQIKLEEEHNKTNNNFTTQEGQKQIKLKKV